MRVIKERRIPATKKHIVKAQPERVEKYETLICDICKKCKSNYRICLICERDLCGLCNELDPTDNGDYPDSWCPYCLELWTETYETEMWEIESNFDDAEAALKDDWKAESLTIGRKNNE